MVYLRSRFTQIRISKTEHHPTLPIRPISHVEPTSSDLIWLSTTNLRFGTVYYLAWETVGTCSWPGQDLMLSSKGLPGGEGVHVPLFPMRILQLFPCSSKIHYGVPRNSLWLSSPVPRNSAPCSLDQQKYSSLLPFLRELKCLQIHVESISRSEWH